MTGFVKPGSIARRIWGSSDLILLVFAGTAGEFALNRAVDWLFFTNRLPRDPMGRLLSTAAFAPRIFFAEAEDARRTIERVNTIHRGVEDARGTHIPEWAYRDVLYMLMDYSERAFGLLERRLRPTEQEELYDAYRRIGVLMRIPDLPEGYEAWCADRGAHMERDLAFSDHTARLYRQYRRQLGEWRYALLLGVQAALLPERVRGLLNVPPARALDLAMRAYGTVRVSPLRALAHRLLLPRGFRERIARLDRPDAPVASP
jgi:hypothetical protein